MPKCKVLFSIALVLTFLVEAHAQMLTNKGQLIHIGSDAIVSVEGSAVNEGTFTNNGTLSVSGDWNNGATFMEGKGTFILNGNTQQLIKHNNQSFTTLQIAGSGEKILQNNATVTGELILTNGLFTPSEESIFLVKEKAVINGGSAQSYINGRLFHEGTGTKFFPIGKNGSYKPVVLEQVTGVSPVIGFELFEPNLQSQPGEDLQEVSQLRYWQQTILSGSLKSAFIGLSYDNTENIQSIDSIVVAETNLAEEPYRSLGKETVNGTTAEGIVTSKLPITGKLFAIGKPSLELAKLLYIPNAFSPLSMQEEDRMIKLYGRDISSQNLLFRIYNRWGNLIYENNSLEEMTSQGWNGNNMYTGKPETNGLYTYTLEGKFIDGKPFKKVGTITLIR